MDMPLPLWADYAYLGAGGLGLVLLACSPARPACAGGAAVVAAPPSRSSSPRTTAPHSPSPPTGYRFRLSTGSPAAPRRTGPPWSNGIESPS
jgi:hypothetical protein